MQGGQQAVDLVALFFAPFFALIIVLAMVAFSPLNKFSRPIRFFLFGGIGGAVTMMILVVIGLLGKVSTGVWRFDVVLTVIASALIGLGQFGASGKLTDKTQDEPERIHRQDSGWF
jgi:lipopolysaccharide export LptBFGC system permease protein LptF